jgi:hypothetical protein
MKSSSRFAFFKRNPHKKALYRYGKETAYKERPRKALRYDQSLVIRKITFPVPCIRQVSRLAAYGAAAFPIAQWLHLRGDADPHTVTRSHRRFTCFPFNPRPSRNEGTDCDLFSSTLL